MQTLPASFVLVLRETHFSLCPTAGVVIHIVNNFSRLGPIVSASRRWHGLRYGSVLPPLSVRCICFCFVFFHCFTFSLCSSFFMVPLVVGHDFMWRHLQITIYINALFVRIKFTLQMSGVKCEWQWRKSKDPNLCAGQGVQSRLHLSNLIYFGIQNLHALCQLIPCSLISALYTLWLFLASANLIKFCLQ